MRAPCSVLRQSAIGNRGSWIVMSVLSCIAIGTRVIWADDSRFPIHDSRASTGEVGVLVLAHGGSWRWNQTVREAVAQAHLDCPTEVAFGMGMHAKEVKRLQRAVEQLERRKVNRIVVVPLLVSSSSEVMRQFEYLFGVREHGPWETHAKPLALHVPVVMAAPLDDDPAVAQVLVERARAMSRTPEQEAVVLIAHGPNAEDDNAAWLHTMERLARQVQAQGHFRAVLPVTMRDDASKPVREEATHQMRALVQAQSQHGRTLVVPLLLANGGIEAKIPKRLHGLAYLYQRQTLLPHPALSQWIARRVAAATELVAAAKQL